MAGLKSVGTGLAAGPHPTIPNLWVREVDQTVTTVYPPPILTAVIKGVADTAIDTTANTYSHGCILTQVDGTTNLSAQWENVGTYASPVWERWQEV